MTERSRYAFTVKEFADGTPWIACEPLHSNIEHLKNGILGFDLPEGTSYEEATQIANYMSEHIAQVTYTPLR